MMHRLIYHMKKEIKERQYKKYINEHLEYIDKAFEEMVMCPDMAWIGWETGLHADLYDQIKVHDESKWSVEEFEPYRKNFYPINDEEKALNEEDFETAWKHHYRNNRHHWECRQYDECPNGKLTKEQQIDCLENVIDWMAMGYKFNDRPYQFYEKNKDKISLPEAERNFIEKVIYEGVDKKYIKGGKR